MAGQITASPQLGLGEAIRPKMPRYRAFSGGTISGLIATFAIRAEARAKLSLGSMKHFTFPYVYQCGD